LVSLVEAVLEDFVGLELDGIGLVDFPPKELVALRAGDEAGLGEVVRNRVHIFAGVSREHHRSRLAHRHDAFDADFTGGAAVSGDCNIARQCSST